MINIFFAFSVGITICAGMFLSWRDREIVAVRIILVGSLALLIGIPFLNRLVFGLTDSVSALVTFITLLMFIVCVRLFSARMAKSRII